jgi:hypothetical protein
VWAHYDLSFCLYSYHVSTILRVVLFGSATFLFTWLSFWLYCHKWSCIYFDAQDFAKYGKSSSRKLPLSSVNGTFNVVLNHYISVTKVLITVASASIAFGHTPVVNGKLLSAKVILAFSVLYGVLFCASLLYRYDTYNQDVESYSRFWFATVQALGFSALACFIIGYGVWACTLG